MTEGLPEPNVFHQATVILNGISTLLLVAGYAAIRRGRRIMHQRLMTGALVSSAAFLAVYLYNHALHGSTPYPLKSDWSYRAYLVVLLPHIVLAALMVPFILRGVWLAWRGRFEAHRLLMRWVWPVWLYVSITGVLVYGMLYTLPSLRV